MRLILAIASVFLLAAPLMAETYTWDDEAGTANFTENYSSIPAKYRKAARKLGDMGSEAPPASAPATASATRPVQESKGGAVKGANPATEQGGLFGGRKPEVWQQEMRPLYAEIKRLEQQLAELEALIVKPAKGITKSRLDNLPQEFNETQKNYTQKLRQYNSLNDEANRYGLPAEFRK